MNKIRFREIIQSCHLNFFLGSGLSAPFLSTLGDIEKMLTDIDKYETDNENIRKIARVSILKSYYDNAIAKNQELISNTDENKVLIDYKSFMRNLNDIIFLRKTNLLNRQVNLFTTNMDIFLEKALEDSNIEFNDGFVGRLKPHFDLSNFKKSILKTSAHYENTSELPLFNIMKIHGSVTWNMKDEERISFDNTFTTLKELDKINFGEGTLVEIRVDIDDKKKGLKEIDRIVQEAGEIAIDENHNKFEELYEKLVIINPTKEKFKFTTLNYTYYELLRIFSNELEKENSVLFVMGFSFSDEHIREITLRAVNSNPTLLVVVFPFSKESAETIKENLKIESKPPKYNNLIILSNEGKTHSDEEPEEIKFDLNTINSKYFGELVGDLNSNKKEIKKTDD